MPAAAGTTVRSAATRTTDPSASAAAMRSTPSASRKGMSWIRNRPTSSPPRVVPNDRSGSMESIRPRPKAFRTLRTSEDLKEAAFSEERARQLKADRSRHTLVFGIVVLAWLASTPHEELLQRLYSMGEGDHGPVARPRAVPPRQLHGCGLGMFGDSTFLLGVMSLIVCVLLTVYLFFQLYRPNIVQVVGASARGGGRPRQRVSDRFALGYVVDFIEPVFIDFPVFNVADIGVTCGFVLFLVALSSAGATRIAYPQSLPRPTAKAKEPTRDEPHVELRRSTRRRGSAPRCAFGRARSVSHLP